MKSVWSVLLLLSTIISLCALALLLRQFRANRKNDQQLEEIIRKKVEHAFKEFNLRNIRAWQSIVQNWTNTIQNIEHHLEEKEQLFVNQVLNFIYEMKLDQTLYKATQQLEQYEQLQQEYIKHPTTTTALQEKITNLILEPLLEFKHLTSTSYLLDKQKEWKQEIENIVEKTISPFTTTTSIPKLDPIVQLKQFLQIEKYAHQLFQNYLYWKFPSRFENLATHASISYYYPVYYYYKQTEAYETNIWKNIWNWFPTLNSPNHILKQDKFSTGNCWSFDFSSKHGAAILLEFPFEFFLQNVSIGHDPNSPDWTAAPKQFQIFSFEKKKKSSAVEWMQNRITSTEKKFLEEWEPSLQFSYKKHHLQPMQIFSLSNQQQQPVQYIIVQILSNYGNSNYSCLYHLGIHGKIATKKS